MAQHDALPVLFPVRFDGTTTGTDQVGASPIAKLDPYNALGIGESLPLKRPAGQPLFFFFDGLQNGGPALLQQLREAIAFGCGKRAERSDLFAIEAGDLGTASISAHSGPSRI